MFAGSPLDYWRRIKIGLQPRLRESVPGCPGPWATPFCPLLAKTGGPRWDFLSRLFPPVPAYKRFIWASVQVFKFLVPSRTSEKSRGIGPQITSSPPFSPTNESLCSFLQQGVQPSLAHPTTKPHLLNTNALRCTSVDSHGTNALHCCTSSSCSTCPAIPGAHATNFASQIYFFHCRQQALARLSLYRSHAHTAGLLSTALPTTAQHDSTAYSSIGHTHVGAFAVDVTLPQPDNLVVAALITPLHCSSNLHCCTDALRCTHTLLRAYAHCCTSALRTTDGRIFVTVISPLRHILEFSERCVFLLAFSVVLSAWRMPFILQLTETQILIWAQQRRRCSLHCCGRKHTVIVRFV